MPTLPDPLPAIQGLREQRDQLGDQAYALRTAILRTRAALRAQRQLAGRQVGADAEEVARARGQIAALETELRAQAAAGEAARARIARADEALARVAFLERSLAGARASITELERLLQEESEVRPPDWKRMEAIRQLIETARAQEADTERSLEAAQADDTQARRDAAAAREALRAVAAESARLRDEIDGLQAEIGALRDATGPTPDDLSGQLASLNQEYAGVRAARKEAAAALQAAIAKLYQEDPHHLVAEMSDATPFLLLPVRIETRFVAAQAIMERPGAPGDRLISRVAEPRARGNELWLRIYPDDVAVHTHEDALTDREVAVGEAYWLALYGIETGGGGDVAARKTETWRGFAALFGPSRAAWVARRTRPTNWAGLSALGSANDLVFPTHDLTKTSAWSRAPRTRVLPDRFVVRLYPRGGGDPREVVGRVVPDELVVGPEPMDLVADADDAEAEAESSFVTQDGQLTFGGDFAWASDFEKAVEVGMGVRIPLSDNEAAQGFDRIIVLGVMGSADSAAGQKLLEELLGSHQHSPRGLSLLGQGTATNNTDDNGSGYSVNDSLEHVQEVTGLDVPRFGAGSDGDGRRLADALGVSYETLHFVYNADNTDHADAVAMNRALYPATLGYYFDSMLRPVLSEDARERVRDWFVERVTGRGPLTPLRVGDQPYGVLLTSDFGRWADPAPVTRRDPFHATLLAVLRHFDALWQRLLPQLMYAGKPGVTNDQVLMNVLGLQPGSVTFAQRVGYSSEYLWNLADFRWGGAQFQEMVRSWTRESSVASLLATFGWFPSELDPERPLVPKLIYQHYTTALDAANLVDAVPLSETEGVRELDAATHRNYLHWLRDAASVNALSRQDFGGAPAPTALLYLKLRHALLLQLHKSAVTWIAARGVDTSATHVARTFHNIRPAGDLNRWEVMRAPVQTLDPGAGSTLSVGDFLLTATAPLAETEFLAGMRESLGALAGRSTARLERCFTEHLDACTYRLDAWQMGLFEERLDTLRNAAKVGGDRRTGIYLGAFGWVEDVKPSPSFPARGEVPEKLRSPKGLPLREYADNGGFVHAPSLNHATAAALLRAGYMAHATPAAPDVMAVNLTSERVRRALAMLQGMRNGQSLEALLGYQFERGIHDRASADSSLAVLNGFLFDIRRAFPIRRVRVAGGAEGGAEETVEAYDVVDGVALAGASPDWFAITGASGAVLTAPRLAALDGERDRLADTLDAVKDLLLAEGAYQLVQGNFDRAGAVLTSTRDAHVPPELDVIRTPRASTFTFTQRVAVHFPRLVPVDPLDPMDPAVGWTGIAMTPRALLEPGVNQWLAGVLGAPEGIVFTASELHENGTTSSPSVLTARDLALQPIDLVYVLGADATTGADGRTGASELETRVAWRYRADHGLGETTRVQISFAAPQQAGTVTFAEAAPLLRALQTALTDSRALDARDYHTSTQQGGTPSTGRDFAELRARAEALQARLDGVLAALRALPFTATIGTTGVATLGAAFTAIRAQTDDAIDLAETAFTFTTGDALLLQRQLVALAAFGVADAFPRTQGVGTELAKAALVQQALEADGAAAARGLTSAALLADAVAASADSADRATGLAADACKAILGQAFAVLPLFTLDNEAELLQSGADRALLDHAAGTLGMTWPEEEWLRSVACVRPRVAAWERIRLLHETLQEGTLALTAVQLPYRAQDSWLAVEYPALDAATGEPFAVSRDTLSLVVHGASAFAAGAPRAGIVIDDWTETIPAREQGTGVAFHYNRPNAMPPQALLLAVPPALTGHWSWEALVGILEDTLRRARLRAVEPHLLDRLPSAPEAGVLLPALLSEFQQYDLNVSLDLRLNLIGLMPLLTGFYVNPNL